LVRLLGIGASRGFKLWRYSPLRALFALGVVLLVMFLGAWILVQLLDPLVEFANRVVPGHPSQALTMYVAGRVLLGLAIITTVASVYAVLRKRKSVTVLCTGFLVVTVGWLPALVHLAFFDRLYLRLGRIRPRSGRGTV
jgi:hypothetical protein